MKIAIDCRLIGSSGIGTYIENIVHHAVNHPEVQFLLIGRPAVLSAYGGCPNVSVLECTHRSFSLGELFHFPVAQVNACDAFFTPNFNIPMGIRVPVFSTVHDVVFLDVSGLCSAPGRLLRRAYIRRALAVSRAVFTVSQFSKDRIESLFRPRCPLHVVYNGVARELTDYKARHPVSTERLNQIVCLGNLKKHKDIHTLLSAFSRVRRQLPPDTRLLVVGNFSVHTRDTSLVQLLQQPPTGVEFVSGATNQQVYQLLSTSRLLVSPSRYEGFGLPPLEALSLGTPVLISDIPAHREVYGGSPASYFRVGDVGDLSAQLLRHFAEEVRPVAADDFLRRYDYAATARQILAAIAP